MFSNYIIGFNVFAAEGEFVREPLVGKLVWGVIVLGIVACLVMYYSFATEGDEKQVYSKDDAGIED